MRRSMFGLLLFALGLSAAHAEMQVRPVEWKVGDDAFSGYLVYDDTNAIKRPGVVMVPDWKGISDSAITKAKHIAGDDYVVLLADVYGKDVRPKNDEESMAIVKKLYGDRTVLRARVNKAVDVLRAAKDVPLDAKHIGAIGYCFGGATVLELARSGADVDAVATFHGGLDTTMPAKPGTVKASVLVLNGADDQGTKEDIPAFENEMNAAKVDWQFVNFSGAVHCFALPDANKPPGCMYNELAMRRSERMMRTFFAEKFAN
ncbi:dienelactone hydrolase family protein [Lysobacter sp. A6]|uniref:Dienelactone hydrolase family protein n=1 Tax=Noviluteimonas lactosilytica TaxID=2888523 RepID=A0ABS8JK96_9GAMM|nr:dienelactone hydrolase family protein [Lysobacter lactosilyticus]MCC8363915.1 dienelactone hydrolase family protein [Lysobacter lactosilyticus]